MRLLRSLLVCPALFVLWGGLPLAAGENWPDFRGPDGQGHTEATALPLTWSEQENIAWKTEVPGRGWSSPIVWDGQIWLTTATEEGAQLWALCVDAQTGEIVHNILVFENDEPVQINPLNSHASPSAVVEDGRVYLHYGTYGTACLDSETGEVLWERRDLKIDHIVGPGSSPVLFEDLLIVPYDGADVQFIVGLDKHDGHTVWRTDRSYDYTGLDPDICKAFCTPILVEHDGRQVLVSPAAGAAMAYDPATGEELWQFRYEGGYSNVARPVAEGDLVFLDSGFNSPVLYAVRLDGSGDVTESGLAWSHERNVPNKPSPIIVDGLLYMISDDGIAKCLEAETGDVEWTKRVGGNFSASPLATGDRIYFCDQEGKTTVIAASGEYQVLAENTLDEGCMASPAVSGDALFLRTDTHLYRIENP